VIRPSALCRSFGFGSIRPAIGSVPRGLGGLGAAIAGISPFFQSGESGL
jgi:hypothetical protein